eukprot:GEMP01009959.1.p1 GENE.GEMP01009959.1~~GEMP01009959.1.p1  ORF type:complete len:846 (+),score=245.37 GEMP01009959.1:137-2674(+)
MLAVTQNTSTTATKVTTLAMSQAPSHTENFRTNNVRFLQDQNKQALAALQRVEDERDEALMVIRQWEMQQAEDAKKFEEMQLDLEKMQDTSYNSRATLQQKDEHIRVLSEQNRQLLGMLEQEEGSGKELATQFTTLKDENERLSVIERDYEAMKNSGDQQVVAANNEVVKLSDCLKASTAEEEQIGITITNYLAQGKADMEALQAAVTDAKKSNTKHLQQIQHNEVQEHRLLEDIHAMKEALEELMVQNKSLKMHFDGDQAVRSKWTKNRGEIAKRLEDLEATAEELRRALQTTEEANARMLEDNRKGAEKYREMGDKVYSLMDQLRLNQVESKKQEQETRDKHKLIQSHDKQLTHLQQKLSVEVNARQQSDQDMRAASQMQALLQKKSKKLEDTMALCMKAQEKAEKRLQELADKSNALQTQNTYLASRVDGQEEDKSALKAELRKQNDEIKAATLTYQNLVTRQRELENEMAELDAEKSSIGAELEYIRREDMLDETGRTKPVLIEATDSTLAERLQVNEFLFSAQQTKNPVPMLIEKVSHFLELLHTSEVQSDQYLQDLQRTNGMLAAMRGKNLLLYEKTQACETWKLRALLKIVSNAFELRDARPGQVVTSSCNLYLDGLQYTAKELTELKRLLKSYEKEDNVHIVRMQENQFDDDKVPMLLELMDTLPYLRVFDLRRNRFSDWGIEAFQTHLSNIPGVTTTERDSQEIRARSGQQLRISVLIADQNEAVASGVLDDLTADLSVSAADAFLATSGGSAMPTGGPQGMEGRGGVPNIYADRSGHMMRGNQPRGSAKVAMSMEGVGSFGGVPIGLGGAGDVGRLGGEKLPRIPSARRNVAARK